MKAHTVLVFRGLSLEVLCVPVLWWRRRLWFGEPVQRSLLHLPFSAPSWLGRGRFGIHTLSSLNDRALQHLSLQPPTLFHQTFGKCVDPCLLGWGEEKKVSVRRREATVFECLRLLFQCVFQLGFRRLSTRGRLLLLHGEVCRRLGRDCDCWWRSIDVSTLQIQVE